MTPELKAAILKSKVGFSEADDRAIITELLEIIEKQEVALENIRWSWANDAGRACDDLSEQALAETTEALKRLAGKDV